MYMWMLVNGDMGGPLEVFLVMQRAPISWGPVININSICSSSMLFSKVTEHSWALIHTSRIENSQIMTADNLSYMLWWICISGPTEHSPNVLTRFKKRASITELATNTIEDLVASLSSPSPIDDSILKEVYHVLQKHQWPPPPGGYPFKQYDQVTTKMGRLPPSPCKVCGSPNHWDKECPDWNVYLEMRNHSVHFMVGQSDNEPELEEKYCAAYAVLLHNRVAGQLLDMDEPSPFSNDQDFCKAVVMSLVRQLNHNSHEHKTYAQRSVSIEEILDEDEERARLSPKLMEGTHILENISDEVPPISTSGCPLPRSSVREVEDEEDIKTQKEPKLTNSCYILDNADESKGAQPPPILPESSTNTYHAYSI